MADPGSGANYGTAVGANFGAFRNKGESSLSIALQRISAVAATCLLVITLILIVVYVLENSQNTALDVILVGVFVPLNYSILAVMIYLQTKGELLTDKITQIWAFIILFSLQAILIDIVLSMLS